MDNLDLDHADFKEILLRATRIDPLLDVALASTTLGT